MFSSKRDKKTVFFSAVVVTALFLSLVSLGGCSLFPDEEEPVKVPLLETKTVEYVTVNPSRRTLINAADGKGKIVPEQRYNASYDDVVTGSKLAEINVKLGDTVNEGDVLCSLENGNLEDNMEIYNMQYEIATLNYNDAYKAYIAGQLNRAGWLQAQINYKMAVRTHNAYINAYESSVLRSPIDGVITYIADIPISSEVKSGQLICTVSDTSNIYIEYSGVNYKNIPLYAQCTITVKIGGEPVSYTGTVVASPSAADSNSPDYNAYKVLIKPEESFPIDKFKLDETLDVYYVVDQSENALCIPLSCVRTATGGRQFVYIMKDGYRQERDVTTGLIGESGYTVDILSGLDENDKVITQ